MRHHIDIFSVTRGVLVVEGWCEQGAPTVLLAGKPLSMQWGYSSSRPDLDAHFHPGASGWGFRVVANIMVPNISHGDLSLDFGGGQVVEAPGARFSSSENVEFVTMLGQLRDASANGGRMLEIGSRARSGNTYRHEFSDKVEHVGIDISDGPCVDIVGDAHHLSRYVEGQFDFAFSISVFEHILMPWKVALEMNKVLKPGALAYIQSHAAYPLHDEPWDFWRYSKDAWQGIFNQQTGFEVIKSGYGQKCRISADFAAGGPIEGLDGAHSYLLSACLIRRTGDAKVIWDAEASQITNLAYTH